MQRKKNKTRYLLWLTAIPSLLLLSACATDPERLETTAEQPAGMIEATLNEALVQGEQTKPVSTEAASNALLPPMQFDLPGKSGIDMEQRFDIKVNRARAREFFMGLVEGTPYNMVVHPEIKERISLDLKNVTVDEVMHMLRDMYGFDYEKTRHGYMVFPNELRSRIFHINYLDVKRKGTSKIRVISGDVSRDNNTGSRSFNNASTNNGSAGSGNNQMGGDAFSGSRMTTTSESDFWNNLDISLQAIVSGDQGQKVVINPHSGVVVIRARPKAMRQVEKFLLATQLVVQRQVILEAKILEVELNDGFQAGVNWALLAESGSRKALVSQTGGGTIFDSGLSDIAGQRGNINPDDPEAIDSTIASAFGGTFAMALKLGNDFAAFIELLKTQGEVQVLSNPQVSTINNQKAIIKVGTDEFFVTDVDVQTITGTATSDTTSDVTLTPFFSGVSLDVIPQIGAEGEITLHVHPAIIRVEEDNKQLVSGGEGQSLSVPLAKSTIRETDTIVRAQSGQVIVIGGLMQNITTDEVAKVPWLGDLPGVGSVFRHTQKRVRKNELVILLKPTVVGEDFKWSERIEQAQKDLRTVRARDELVVE